MSVKNQVGNIASYASGDIIPAFVPTGIKDIMDNMSNAIYQCGVEVNSLKYANTQLLLDRDALIRKLNALINKEILSQHYIVPAHEGGVLNYISLRNNGSSPSIARLANFSIESVCIIEYDPLYGQGQYYCIFLSNGKAIMIPNEKFEPRKIVNFINHSGNGFLLRKDHEVIGSAFIHYLTEYIKKAEYIYMPYRTGWLKDVFGHYVYHAGGYNPLKLNSPYYNTSFPKVENEDVIAAVRSVLNLYGNFFLKECDRVIMISILFYSLLYSIFLEEYDFRVNKVVNICSDVSDSSFIQRIANLFLNVFSTNSYYSIKATKKEFINYILNTKDVPLILNGKIEDNYYEKNAITSCISQYFVEGVSFEYNERSYKAESLLICLNCELEYMLDKHDVIVLNINKDDIDNKHFFSDNRQYKKALQIAVKGFVDHVSKAQLNFCFDSNSDGMGENIIDENICTYKLFKKSLDLFKNFVSAKGINFEAEFGLTQPYAETLSEFFSKEIQNEESITMLFLDTIFRLIEN